MPSSTAYDAGVFVTSRTERAGCVIALLRGELDIAAAPALREELLGLLRPGASRLIIDLSAVGYADASGIAVLVGTGRRAGLLGGWLRLASPTPEVISVLSATGLNRHLVTFATVEEAITGRHPDTGRHSDTGRHPDTGMVHGKTGTVDVKTGMVDAKTGISGPRARIRPVYRVVRALSAADGGELRAAVTALLAHADAWRDADPRRRLAPTFHVLALAHAGTSNAVLNQAAHSFLAVLGREPLRPSPEAAATASRLRHLLYPATRPAAR